MVNADGEFLDEDREVMDDYYELCEQDHGHNHEWVKRELRSLIEKDPRFFDSYLYLRSILIMEGDLVEAQGLLDSAHTRALELIVDQDGNWPRKLEWAWLGNRHIIRVLHANACSLWERGENDAAIDLFRRLLKANQHDNLGARYCMLAIRLNLTHEQFLDVFDADSGGTGHLFQWFRWNSKKFPEEFGWWEEAVKELM